MKNGVNSAKRYTNAHIKDYRRQLAIDLFVSGKSTTNTIKTDEQMAEMVDEKLRQEANSESAESSSSDEESIGNEAGVSCQKVDETPL